MVPYTALDNVCFHLLQSMSVNADQMCEFWLLIHKHKSDEYYNPKP
jgi:hypothetical protein